MPWRTKRRALHAGAPDADYEPGLTVGRPNSPSTLATLGNWTNGWQPHVMLAFCSDIFSRWLFVCWVQNDMQSAPIKKTAPCKKIIGAPCVLECCCAVLGTFPPTSQTTHEAYGDEVMTVDRGNMAVIRGCQHVPYSRPPADIDYLLNGSRVASSRQYQCPHFTVKKLFQKQQKFWFSRKKIKR